MNIQRERTLGALSAQCEAFRQAQSDALSQSSTITESFSQTETRLIVATTEAKKDEKKGTPPPPPTLPILPSSAITFSMSFSVIILCLVLSWV
jgi:hypothetical protein